AACITSRSLSSPARWRSRRRARSAATRERTPNHNAMINSATMIGLLQSGTGTGSEMRLPIASSGLLVECPRAGPRDAAERSARVTLLALRVVVERPRREVFVLTVALAPGPDVSPAPADIRLTTCESDDTRLVEERTGRPVWLGEWPAPGEPSPAARRGSPV